MEAYLHERSEHIDAAALFRSTMPMPFLGAAAGCKEKGFKEQ